MVYMNEVKNVIDQMMRVDIFHPTEKLRMVRDEENTFLDPNLIMDARHRILRENLSVSPMQSSVLTEAKRLLTQEETKDLYVKKQQRFLERELKKFEMELSRFRPDFSKPYVCKKRAVASSDDEDFWGTSRRIRDKTNCDNKTEKRAHIARSKNTNIGTNNSLMKVEDERNSEETSGKQTSGMGNMKVMIKDKPNVETDFQRLNILKKYFDVLKQNAEEKQRLRDIKTKIQQNMFLKIMREYFDLWRTRTKSGRNDAKKQKENEVSEERKIEMFINAITERQKELMKKPKVRNINSIVKEPKDAEMKKKAIHYKHVVVESPAQSRLNAQKQIIEKQRAKLAEQNRIIEELKIKQAQNDISKSSKETMNMAKDAITHCGQSTRRTLIQLMQQTGYRDAILTVPQRAPEPPKFLLRMEARAEARRNRIKLAEEERRKKLEEQKQKEQAVKLEEEERKRRLQQEALYETRRLRREQEQKRLREIEKFKRLNEVADEFYRKYLLRCYILNPFMILMEKKRNSIKRADIHYKQLLTKRVFSAWRKETETQCRINVEFAESVYNRNLMVRIFEEWKQTTKEENLKYQVAVDFYDMKLIDKYFKLWEMVTMELRAQYAQKAKVASDHYKNKLKAKYFCTWRKYLTIAEDIKESEKRKDELRQLVQRVIPDFDPKHRGVALED